MAQSSEERMARLLQQIEQNPGLAESLPSDEGAMVRDAVSGMSVYEIAQQHSTSEESVWRTLGNAARLSAGTLPAQPIETGGFGSDTDPGVTGGYGDTGFGSLSADIDPGVIDEFGPTTMGASGDALQSPTPDE